ncbi:MAG TPA: Ig-like domain-containing protein, partial [Gemmatimonadales bacterium]|nr:Ig-like domain-containing protein [Gemmatimonadales bacterium]
MKARLALTGAAAAVAACELPGRHVTDPPPPSSTVVQVVTIPDTAILDPYQERQFLAFGRTQAGDSVGVEVRWSVSGGTITAAGVYTADTVVGDYQVTAAALSSSATGSSQVKNRGPLAQVILNPATTSLVVGGSQLFATYGRRRNGDSVAVTVNYSATGGTVSAAGVYTAGPGTGLHRVIATQAGGTLADTAAITITNLPVASVTVSPAAASVTVGQTVQLAATPKDASGNPLSGRVVTWATSNAAVATVSGSGLVTGGAAGTATITASSEGKNGTAAITVTVVPVATVTVSPAAASVPVGQTVQLAATPKDASGNPLSGRVVTWATSNAAVATVNGSGLVTGGAAGTATITASSEGKNGTAAITVTTTVTNPGTVTTLAVVGVTDSSVTLSFTEVSDGAGQPASYDVRYAVGTISWGAAPSVSRGSCATPLGGSAIGVNRTCTVLGLAAATGYQFQLVAFRGTLNVNAVYGALSNVASATTVASSAPVASVT